MSTNSTSTSGMTYLFDAPTNGLGRYLSAHDRSGQSVPWATTSPLNLMIPGFAEGSDAAINPGAAADPDGGVWVAWDKDGALGGYVRIAAHVTVAGGVTAASKVSTRSGFRSPAVVAESSSRVWIADADGYDITAIDFDGVLATPPALVVAGPFPPNDPANIWDTRDLYAFDWQGERWLSFSEHSTLIHIVKVRRNCIYRAAFRPAGP